MLMMLTVSGCASFSGLGGQFTTVETVQLSKQPASFVDSVIEVGKSLGYQYTGGNRATNLVQLADQPNFGESVVLGRNYSVQLSVQLKPNGGTVEMTFISFGSRSTSGEAKSQKRIREFKDALRAKFGA
tara:strand:+ start:38141 stop:38527 length:387 start_codon:yes stop_codon:yes gene_type:complete